MENLQAGEKKEFTTGFFLALIAVVLWSGNFIVARGLRHEVSPVSLAFFRWVIATVFLLPIAYKNLTADFHLLKKNWLLLSIAAITGVSIFNTFLYIAGRYTTATNMALIGTTAAPVFVLSISAAMLKQKISRYQWSGALICIIGIVILISGGSMNQLKNFRFSAGDLWILAAALSFAIYTILVRRKPKDLSATAFLFSIFLLGTIFLLPFYFFQKNGEGSVNWSTANVVIFLYLGIGASVIAFLCWNLSIKKIGASRTALFGNLIPVFSSAEAAFILDERFTAITLISFVIITLGILIANFHAFSRR